MSIKVERKAQALPLAGVSPSGVTGVLWEVQRRATSVEIGVRQEGDVTS